MVVSGYHLAGTVLHYCQDGGLVGFLGFFLGLISSLFVIIIVFWVSIISVILALAYLYLLST